MRESFVEHFVKSTMEINNDPQVYLCGAIWGHNSAKVKQLQIPFIVVLMEFNNA